MLHFQLQVTQIISANFFTSTEISYTPDWCVQQAPCFLCVCWLMTPISTRQNMTALCNLFAGGGINFHMIYKPCKATFLCFYTLGKPYLMCKDGFIYNCFEEEWRYLEQKYYRSKFTWENRLIGRYESKKKL